MARKLKAGDRVYWDDPDGGLCSGRYTVTAVRGETVSLRRGTHFAEAPEHELTKLKPLKGDKMPRVTTPKGKTDNPFLDNPMHMGEITVRQLMEVVQAGGEFPKGLDTVIRIGDVEGNNRTNGKVCLTCHRPEDVVLSIDPNEGEFDYGDDTVSDKLRKGEER